MTKEEAEQKITIETGNIRIRTSVYGDPKTKQMNYLIKAFLKKNKWAQIGELKRWRGEREFVWRYWA